MYGETPKAKRENLSKVPPPSKFMIPKIPFVASLLLNEPTLTPGIVIPAPKRYTNKIPSVKMTFRRAHPFAIHSSKKLTS